MFFRQFFCILFLMGIAMSQLAVDDMKDKAPLIGEKPENLKEPKDLGEEILKLTPVPDRFGVYKTEKGELVRVLEIPQDIKESPAERQFWLDYYPRVFRGGVEGCSCRENYEARSPCQARGYFGYDGVWHRN